MGLLAETGPARPHDRDVILRAVVKLGTWVIAALTVVLFRSTFAEPMSTTNCSKMSQQENEEIIGQIVGIS